MAMEINTVLNKDCVEGMAAMDGGSVDLVIADPPYFQGEGGGGGSFGVKKKNHRTEIDKMMCGISDECIEQMARVCKRVNMYIFCSVLQIPQYLAFATRNGYKFDILTWHKTNAVPACNGKYMPDTEYIVFIKESGVPLYGTAATKRKYYVTPTNVKDKRKWGHPTIKPLNIVQNLIINSTQEGGVVLDPFMGSGTTAVACIRTGRNYIGFELNKEYYDKACKRIKLEQAQLTLF